MFFSHPNMTSNSNQDFDEHRWVLHIRRTIEIDEIEGDHCDIPVSIFRVPKTLMATNPDSFVPQQIAIGPYHHFRPELYEIETYKLAAAKTTQKKLQNFKFQHLVDQFRKFEPRFRASYNKYLNFNGETLAWMIAVDASFLLEFLQIYVVKEGKVLTKVSSTMFHLIDVSGRKSAHNAILRDMVMLENQIPLFSLRKILEFQFSSLEEADSALHSMLTGFSKELSPFKKIQEWPNFQVVECAHLLDLLYHMIVPKLEGSSEMAESKERKDENEKQESEKNYLAKTFSKLKASPVNLIKRLIFSRPAQLIFKLPWKIFSNLPVVIIIKQPVEYLWFSQEKQERKPDNETCNLNVSINKPPLMEEITIPSVTELSKAGVKFSATDLGILSINFNEKTSTFYLPTVNLDGNTEVVLRNLVAYEACNASGPLVFTRYTELMNGIIDTEDDAKFLREHGIISNQLKSDEEVANLWNGISKSIRLTKVSFLDKVIEDVNKNYNGRWKVKVDNLMKHVPGSWQSLTLVAVILILLLMILQAFCSVYNCARSRRSHAKTIE
ncbi:UPF0481 At3g02645 [Olea europaea subsp. europaea]|uniref:UPF0481 At3g02645 n=1 Tax=Olea europaea subsp. europaea TaxID=158383 RepID=A0A8S0SPZ1_OLEEU|nr:UPF0481 At3g02645 [Olea europaea subsp. europaea]